MTIVLIEVAFKGNRKDFFLWEHDETPPVKTAVIVDADRGEDLGFVHAVGELAEKRNRGTPHGYGEAGTTKHARRLATPEDIARATELREQDDDARRRAQERVRANDLLMKLTDAEWQWDRKKLTLYFTADKRVDFRALVRELASMFRTRIELKQIGVRDEAKRLDGIGRCGRQYCSSSWLPELRPVNLGVAKDQRLSLNPSQISGACGRLMCCLRYEHEFYVQSRKRFPKEGKIVRTAKGDEKVIANDIFRERVTLRGEDGEQRVIALADLHAEAGSSGVPLPVAFAAAAVEDVEEPTPEELLLPNEEDLVTGMRITAEHVIEPPAAPVPDPTLSSPVTAPTVSATTAAPTPSTDGEPAGSAGSAEGEEKSERRPHRRRGRRGGRRNRSNHRAQRDESGEGANGAPDAAHDDHTHGDDE